MTQPATMGYQVKLSMAASGTGIASYTEAYEINGETLKRRNKILDPNGQRATRSRPSERVRFDVDDVSGSVNFDASPLMLDLLLPRILGAAKSGTTFALADTLPTFDVLVERNSAQSDGRYLYASCYVNRAVFRARAGSFVELVLDLIGVSETPSATAFPAITLPTDYPYVFTDGVLNIVSLSGVKMMDFELTIDNFLHRRYSNSLLATSITPMDRLITLTTTNPFTTDERTLQNQVLAGAAGTIVFTGPASNVLTFTFGNLQAPDDTPTASSKLQENPLKLVMVARTLSTTKELVVTSAH